MDIVYATSDNFVDILAVSLASLYETNGHLSPRVWILSYGVTDSSKLKLEQLARQYNQAPIEWLEDMTLPAELQSDRGSLSQFGRLFLGTILPESVHQVLYLDGDTVIKGSLDQLVETPFDGAIVMGGIGHFQQAV